MTSRTPTFTDTFSFGNAIQIFVILVAAAGGWFQLQAQANSTEKSTAALVEATRDATTARQALEVRVRALETQVARSDERFSSILGYLSRIDTRLERIERGQW